MNPATLSMTWRFATDFTSYNKAGATAESLRRIVSLRYNQVMSITEQLNALSADRVLILDGAMGSMIQNLKLGEADFRGKRFAEHKTPLAGCNDLLCLTRPDVISNIHEAYLKAGADIIETCSLNSTSTALDDYGLGAFSYEISRAAAALARKAADKYSSADKPRFAAGSIGATTKSASLSPDINDPAKRGIYWDALAAAYYDNARGLLDGGADMLLIETMYDTLNMKAALFAISRLCEERAAGADSCFDVPVIVSATISNNAGRLLSGQSVEAFCVSLLPMRPWALGLNCSFGAETLLPHLQKIAAAVPCRVSVYPNAGLPNEFGAYDESPETMAAVIEKYLQQGLVNIVGGCCGTTPAHIAAIAEKAARYAPRRAPDLKPLTSLCGLDVFTINAPRDLVIIGERANVAGSRAILRLVSEKNYGKAMALVRDMISHGAEIIDVGMDDPMLDSEHEMKTFLNHALSDPDIAKIPLMIDSSRWNVIEAGLKCVQGKPLVNSISLKDGEDEFIRRARLLRRYGAAVVVMLIDEQGQALDFERKIEIARRAYRLLTNAPICFPPENIVFDPNVLAVATGIQEHNSYALDFIRACSWIREHCPYAQITGGISNLSFSFRGNNPVREAMHSVFLYHAVRAGLTMAIVNPAAMIAYDSIEPALRSAVEDVILNRTPGAADRLLEIAEKIAADNLSGTAGNTAVKKNAASEKDNWRNADTRDRIIYSVVKGIEDFVEADVLEFRAKDISASPIAIVEGPLMEGIKEVGRCFAEGKMYLPQVIRSAMVMKKAVSVLEPFIKEEKQTVTRNLSNEANTAAEMPLSAKIVLATVKGDVHDIGKNIVGVVLGCNGYEIVDLGVMIPREQIIETAIKENAAAVGISGLISPSLDEMIQIAREMEKRGLTIPLLIGGAAANLAHTALRIAPEYSGAVIYVPDAAQAAAMVRALMSHNEKPAFLESLAEQYREAAGRHESIRARIETIPLETARANKAPPVSFAPPDFPLDETLDLNDYSLDKIIPRVDWQAYLQTWELAEKTYPRAFESNAEIKDAQIKLLRDAENMLARIKTEKLLSLRGIVEFFPAARDSDDVVLFEKNARDGALGAAQTEIARFCFLRNQEKKRAGAYNPCLADFFAPSENAAAGGADRIGLFALSAGFGLAESVHAFQKTGDNYSAILLATLANALAEAFAEEIHLRFGQKNYAGIRPVFGYPISPDHEDRRLAFDLLQAGGRCGIALSESAMMIPAASVCGMLIMHPAAYYFGIGHVGEDQLADWARRKKISSTEARRRAGMI